MAFFPQAVDGECCETPCQNRESPCDPCDECECKVDSGQYVKVNYTLKKQRADEGGECFMAYSVCSSVRYFYALDSLCGYEAEGPQYVEELDEWQTEGLRKEGCNTKGLGSYYSRESAPSGDIDILKIGIYTASQWSSNPKLKVIEQGVWDDYDCGGCTKTITFDCNEYTDDSGGTGLPLCSDPSLEKPCNDGPYPKEGEGDEPCCPQGENVCGNSPQDCSGSGVVGSGVQGSGVGSGCVPCCVETNDCYTPPKCCERDEAGDKVLPDCPAEGECCDGSEPVCGSGVQGSGTQGSGTQGSGCCTETNNCGECCTDPADCECDNCYDGVPTKEFYCEETITDDCSEVNFTPPSSAC